MPEPFGGLLLALLGSTSLASKRPRVWFDFFVLNGPGAKLYYATWLLAGLALCVKHYI